MAKYNSMRDIPYLKFMEFSNEIMEHSKDHVFIGKKVIEHFYPEVTENEDAYVEEFSNALNNDKKGFIPYLVCLNRLNVTEHFIDCVNYGDAKMYRELFSNLLRPLWWFGKVNVDNITLSDGQRIMQLFIKGSMKSNSLTNIFIIRQLRLQLVR